jgi:hypothetical protein
MRYFMPDPSEFTGGNAHEQPLDTIPTGMETDPHADEDVIDNHSMEEYPEPVQTSDESAKIVPDDLADSIAYALDGSGPGPINATPTVSGHSVI